MRQIDDVKWRLNNLYHIVDKGGADVVFKMNWAQEQLFNDFENLNVILKARQLGMTTFIDILLLDTCLFNDHVSAGIIAHTREDAENIFKSKIKHPYDKLPDAIKNRVLPDQDTARQLKFKNGSEIRVGTSMRSGTLQYLHISEFGKICAKYPDKAEEIVSGSLNTVQSGNYIFIESTAEGRDGYFFDYCRYAQEHEAAGKPFGPLDFKFHFYPWWKHKDYSLDEDYEKEPELDEYFERLKDISSIELTDGQKQWYAKKKQQQGEYIFREFPSTPEEAFLVSNEGFFYGAPMAKARRDGRVGNVPLDPSVVVDTVWDLGMSDSTVIWMVQKVRQEIRLIDYYEATDEGLAHYVNKLHQLRDSEGYLFGVPWVPHDIQVRELSTGKSRLEAMRSMGLKPRVIPKLPIEDGIEAVRNILPMCWFDEKKCAQGIKALENYKKVWNDKLSCYSSRPLHDWASHGADAFRGLAVISNRLGKTGEAMTQDEADALWKKYSTGV